MARGYRFGLFFYDADSNELVRDGRPVRLQPQPSQVLVTLLDRAGQPVTRDQLRRAVWPDDTFVDFDRGLNFCIAQVRTALGDDAAAPRYIRTLPRKGYQFICPVEASPPDTGRTAPDPVRPAVRRQPLIALAILAAVVVLGLAAYFATTVRAKVPIVAVARFDNDTGDPALARFRDTLTDIVVEQLTRESGGRFAVVGNAAILRRPREERDLSAVASSLHAGYVVLAQIQRDDQRLRVLAHLIRLPDQTHVGVNRVEGPAGETLAAADEVAGRIARAFALRLRDPGLKHASPAAATR